MQKQFAPHGLERCRARPADVAACRTLLRKNSKTFHAASLMLPREMREPASVLYGFCRLADDAIDVHGGQRDAINRLRERLDYAYQGRPMPGPADRALASIVAQYQIPQEVPNMLIEGLEWDAQGRSYESLDDLYAYATRVAGTVGVMMALLMGVRSPAALARASELGIAMQLTNIARDVGEDARMGRVYLPLQWLRSAGIDIDEWLRMPVFSPALGGVVQRLLGEADRLYKSASYGIAGLPLRCRPGINAARFMYARIGAEIARAGYDSVNKRAVVPRRRKAVWLSCALVQLWPSDTYFSSAALPEAQALVCAAAELNEVPSSRGFYDRLVDVLALFERLERSDRLAAANGRRTPA